MPDRLPARPGLRQDLGIREVGFVEADCPDLTALPPAAQNREFAAFFRKLADEIDAADSLCGGRAIDVIAVRYDDAEWVLRAEILFVRE